MALTATAQSALPPSSGPLSWDDEIVPTLRKRLEGESRILAKRMSTASMASFEESRVNAFATTDDMARNGYGNPSQNGLGNAPPRGSLQQARTPSAGGRPGTGSSSSRVNVNGAIPGNARMPPQTRPRTKSQPFSFDSPRAAPTHANGHANGVALPTPESSRSTSPMYQGRVSDVKPTRIPMVARGRTPSTSSYAQNANISQNDTRNGALGGYRPPSPDASPDLWSVQETERPSMYPPSTTSVLTHQRSGLLNEPAPFNPGSLASSGTSHISNDPQFSEAPPRPSNDSEERPFEHWYRGEVSRNGGVGELRVGKRMEMLDIANYGHSLKKTTPSRQASSSRETPALAESARRRRRADSVAGVGARESFYMDEERARDVDMVMDEHPLTDLDGDGDTDIEHSYATSYYSPPPPMPASAADDYRSGSPVSHRTPSRQQSAPPTRIPAPAPRQGSITPTDIPRGSSEPPFSTSPASSSSRTPSKAANMSRSVSTPQKLQPKQTDALKRRAKSPAANTPSPATKRPKPKPKTVSRRPQDDEKNRRSVAEYPAPAEGEDMEHAIPSWTQPVPSGNWDEVVLPAVARKRGLDGQYEKADGSPRPKKPQDERIPPAAGTFGYDPNKYRPPRGEDVPMDEFGQRPADTNRNDDPYAGRVRHSVQDNRRISPSPSPFSQYAPPDAQPAPPVVSIPKDVEQGQPEEEEERGAGCCKCVIM